MKKVGVFLLILIVLTVLVAALPTPPSIPGLPDDSADTPQTSSTTQNTSNIGRVYASTPKENNTPPVTAVNQQQNRAPTINNPNRPADKPIESETIVPSTENESYTLIIVIVSVIVILVAIGIFTIIKIIKVPQELVDYVGSCVKYGYDMEHVKMALEPHGWKDSEIEKAYNKALKVVN